MTGLTNDPEFRKIALVTGQPVKERGWSELRGSRANGLAANSITITKNTVTLLVTAPT